MQGIYIGTCILSVAIVYGRSNSNSSAYLVKDLQYLNISVRVVIDNNLDVYIIIIKQIG